MKNKKILIGSFIFISFILLLIFSMNTSFLYPNYYSENGLSYSTSTLLISKGLSQGLIPYKDLFGINGPIIYFLESVGYFFGQGKLVVFILQVICLSISLIFTYKILVLFVQEKKSYILTCLMLIPIVATFGEGNSVEEFCLPIIMISLYIIINYIKCNKSQSFPTKYSLILGINVGIICFIRFNNVFPVLGAIVALTILNKNNRLSNILYIALGILLVFICCFTFYFVNGAVKEMIYGTFVYNYKTMLEGFSTINEIIRKIIKCLPVIALLLSGFIYGRKSDKDMGKVFILTALFSIIGVITGSGQWHYYIVIVPFLPIAVAVIMSLDISKLMNIFKYVLLVGLIGIYIIPFKSTIMSVYDVNINKKYIADNKVMTDWAKENLNNDEYVVLVDAPTSYYLLNNIMPKTRLFSNQSQLSKVDYDIAKEIQDYVYSTPTTKMIMGTRGWIDETIGEYVFMDYIENIAGTNLAIYSTEQEHSHDH